MRKIIKKLFTLLLLIIAGVIVRAWLSTIISKGDLLVFGEWSKSLYEHGVMGSYFREGWIYSFPTQPPLMMLLFWASSWLHERLYFLAALHNLIRFPPAWTILWLKDNFLFFTKIWAILGDIFGALVLYYLFNHFFHKPKIALLAFIFILFNPVSLFTSGIWGQTGSLSGVLAFLAFLIIYKKNLRLLSPLFFILGILIKPDILILLPFYLFFLAVDIYSVPVKERMLWGFQVLIGLSIGILIAFSSFIPFSEGKPSFFKEIESTYSLRIASSAKGVSLASVSAFNLYSFLATINKTYGDKTFILINYDQLGMVLMLVLNCLLAYFWYRKKGKPIVNRIFWLCAVIYFIAEGTFLFKTGMAERYFYPALLPLIIIFFMTNWKIKAAIAAQISIWFINLFYVFFSREIDLLQTIFEQNYWTTRLFSLGNIAVYFILLWFIFKTKSFNLGMVSDKEADEN